MNLYSLKLHNKQPLRYELIRFCNEQGISIFITWVSDDDIFDEMLFADIVVPETAQRRFEEKYSKAITNMQSL